MYIIYLPSFDRCIFHRYIPLLSLRSPLWVTLVKVGEYSESSVHTIHAQKLGNKVAIEIHHSTTCLTYSICPFSMVEVLCKLWGSITAKILATIKYVNEMSIVPTRNVYYQQLHYVHCTSVHNHSVCLWLDYYSTYFLPINVDVYYDRTEKQSQTWWTWRLSVLIPHKEHLSH